MVDIDVFQTVTSVSFEVEPNTNVININKVTIEGTGGGATNLSPSQTATNFTINSDTGTDATIPLGNGTLAGATINDYTNTEKNKLAGIALGAEVNVNADWNAVSGDAQILNKPTIPTAVTQTSQLTNNGADGVNPFITALDIPTAGQSSTLVREVKNMTGATLTKGTVVYISGANGNKPLVSKALATTDALSARTFGLLQSDISNNGLGNCVIIGDLTGIDTSAFTEGVQLYLSGVTAGTYTSTKTLAPTHIVYVGKVTRSHPTLGQIEVGIQNGYELEEIHDVQIITPTNNDGLFYETSTDLWRNKSIATALGYTPYNATNPSGYQTASQVQAIADAKVANTITNGVTTSAPNQDVVFDALALKANDANVVHLTGAETINGVKTFTDNLIAAKYFYSGGSIFTEFGQTFYINGTGATHSFGGGISNAQNNLDVPNGTLKIGLQTASTIASFDANKNVVSLPIATYPSLTELSYVKGVTSAIQTQLNAKQPLSTVLTNTTASFTIADETKLDGIAAGATANSSDATLLARANHTGTQLSNTISDFNSATRSQVEAELVAGTNITITPSGTGATRQLTIDASGGGSSSQSAYTVLANNTNASAVPTEQVFKDVAEQTYAGATPTWTGTTAPSSTTNHSYQWSQIGKTVNLRVNLDYATAGSGLTAVTFDLPSDCPSPKLPAGVSANGEVICYGSGILTTTRASVGTPTATGTSLRIKGTGTYEINIIRTTATSHKYAYATIQYFAQ